MHFIPLLGYAQLTVIKASQDLVKLMSNLGD